MKGEPAEAMTCGDCPCFKPIPEERRTHGINGEGWCNFHAPHDIQRLRWGHVTEAIQRTRHACHLGPILRGFAIPEAAE